MQTITKEYAYLFHMVECARQELSRLEQMLIEALNPWKMRAMVNVQNEWDKAQIREVTMNIAIPERNILRYP